MYRVEITQAALKTLAAVPLKDRRRLDRTILALSESPRPAGCKRLQGTDEPLWRLRVGTYRIIYAVYDDRLAVLVIRVGSRKDVYRRLG